jgi:IS5 family transposase
MCGARELLGTVVVFGNRTRRAKRRRLGVLNAKDKQQRRRVYRDLLKVTEETYRSAQRVADQLDESGLTEPVKRASAEKIAADFKHFLVLTEKVINQTRRRVIDEERVPAEEKVVSIFEEHTDIIRKDRRETLYGHKVCLTGGSSSMILDCVILDGNPSDSTLAETMIDRQVELYERAPIADDSPLVSSKIFIRSQPYEVPYRKRIIPTSSIGLSYTTSYGVSGQELD